MKIFIYIIITFLIIAQLLLGDHVRLVNVSIRESSINLAIESEEDIYGIQFDLHYNNAHLVLTEDEIQSNVSGIKIYSSINEEGIARILMFGMPGEQQKLLNSKIDTIANLINIEFNARDQFKGLTVVELSNITVAGKAGTELDINKESVYTFDVSFLKPKSTLLVQSLPNPFNSTTTIYYQLSTPSFVTLNISLIAVSPIFAFIKPSSNIVIIPFSRA